MLLFKPKKRYRYKPFERPSLLASSRWKHRLKFDFLSGEKREYKRHRRSFLADLHRTCQALCFCVTFLIGLLVVIDRVTRRIAAFVETIARIIHTVHGWIRMVRSIFSALHLIIARLMILIFKIYQILNLLASLFEPVTNGTFERIFRSFSHFFAKYYSSNGACYTLKARTFHLIRGIRTRWRRNELIMCLIDDDVYYDALNEEFQ